MCFIEITKSLAPIVASLVTIVGVIVALFTYRNSVAIKRVEFINQLYSQFMNKDLYEFYGALLENDTLEIAPNSNNEYQLDKVLTLFDEVCNYYEQGVIDNRSLSYIACEILDFYNHQSVKEYLRKTEEDFDKEGYSKDIRPYSGFLKLGNYISAKYTRKGSLDKH